MGFGKAGEAVVELVTAAFPLVGASRASVLHTQNFTRRWFHEENKALLAPCEWREGRVKLISCEELSAGTGRGGALLWGWGLHPLPLTA